MPRVPEQIAQTWSQTDEGRELLHTLPELLDSLSRRFDLASVGEAWTGGCVGFVAPGERTDGTRVVLKISLSDDEHRHEADALERWGGHAAVLLLDRVDTPNVMLLERLEPGTSLLGHPDLHDAMGIACDVLIRLQLPLTDPHPFVLVTDFARGYTEWIPEAFERSGRRFDAGLAAEAVALCEAFANRPGPQYLVNRDFHRGNVLAAAREPWLAIDPKPLAGERAFDTGHLLRDLLSETPDNVEIGRLVDQLAGDLDLERDRVRGWALVRSVENALWCLEDDPAGGDDDPAAWDVAVAACLARLD